jgi:hypothetical protein
MARTSNEVIGITGNNSLTDPDGRTIVVGPDGVSTSGSASTAVSGAGTANVTTSTGVVVASNSTRTGFQVVNDSDTTVYLGLGTAALANAGIRLNANGGSWDGRVSNILWKGAVNSIHAGTGTKVVAYVEV